MKNLKVINHDIGFESDYNVEHLKESDLISFISLKIAFKNKTYDAEFQYAEHGGALDDKLSVYEHCDGARRFVYDLIGENASDESYDKAFSMLEELEPFVNKLARTEMNSLV